MLSPTQIDEFNKPKANRLLAALPAAPYRRLLPSLEEVALRAEEILFEPTGPMRFVYFPISSVVSLSYLVEEERPMVNAWRVGCEGMVGISLLLGIPDNREEQAKVQFDGLAFRISATALRAEFRRAGALQHLFLRYVSALITQASQLSVCRQYHSTAQRLCGFLSCIFDRFRGNVVFLTHARTAEMLGVRREAITQIACRLQDAGIIKYSRGHLSLINRRRLEERACVCGRIIRRTLEAASA